MNITRSILAAATILSLGAGALPAVADNPLDWHNHDSNWHGDPNGPGEHPRMHEALQELEDVKMKLQNAESDQGGHREEAIRDVDKAIDHVHQAIDYDKHHH